MAIKVNEATEGSGSGAKYTGVALMSPLIANPNKAQLEAMGFKPEKEQEYIKVETIDGKPVYKTRVAVHFGMELGEGVDKKQVFVNNAVFLESRTSFTKDKTKVEVIDKFGKSFYLPVADWQAKKLDDLQYLDHASCRPALVGEAQLVQLMRTMANSDKDEPTELKDFAVGGDIRNFFNPQVNGFAELNSDITAIKKTGNKVKCLLFVRTEADGKHYQDMFPYHIGRAFSDNSYLHKKLRSIYTAGGDYFKGKDFGPINLADDKVIDEQYRMRIWENEVQAPAVAANGPGENIHGYPADWDPASAAPGLHPSMQTGQPSAQPTAPAASPAAPAVFDPFA